MAESKYLKKTQGNGASTTLSSSVSDSDTSAPLTSDTAFDGEGMLLIDEGQATEEFAYGTAKIGSSITILADDRGLEGGSAQAHNDTATVKGIVTSGMWNNLVTAVSKTVNDETGALLKATGAEITTGTEDAKIVTPKAIKDAGLVLDTDGTLTANSDSKVATQKAVKTYADTKSDASKTETLTNKTLTSPKLNEDVVVAATATEVNTTCDGSVVWTAWTPTFSASGGTAPTYDTYNTGKYVRHGKMVTVQFFVQGGAGGTAGAGDVDLTINLPVTAADTAATDWQVPCGIAGVYNNTDIGYYHVRVKSSSAADFIASTTSKLLASQQNSNVRIIWAEFTYEAA